MLAIVGKEQAVSLIDDYGGIEEVLAAWGRCRSMHDASHVGYPKLANFAAKMRNSGQATVRIQAMPDETLTAVDSAVSALKSRSTRKNDLRYRVLTSYYCAEDRGKGVPETLSERAIARILRVARDDVKAARQAAESWVESRLEGA